MSEKRVLLDCASFMDSAEALGISEAPSADIRGVVQRFLAASYDDLGKAPRLLDGEDLEQLLLIALPRHFGVKDPLAAQAEVILDAYLRFLHDTEMVAASFEQRRAFGDHIEGFLAAVRAGTAHREGVARTGKLKQIVNRAEKTGRNDPCPCGSGQKFKKCCMGLGGAR